MGMGRKQFLKERMGSRRRCYCKVKMGAWVLPKKGWAHQENRVQREGDFSGTLSSTGDHFIICPKGGQGM